MAGKNVPKGKGIDLPKVDQSPDGFFTLREAAQAVGLQEQWSTAQIDSLTALLLKAVQGRTLILIDPHSQMPNPDLTARDFYGWITRTAFNNWAQGEGALYWWHDPQKPTVVLSAGTAYVPFSDIAHELAHAIHGPGHGNMAYGVDRINFGDEANKAALRGTLRLKIPRSHVPQAIVVGRARDDSEVAVQDLADFAARFSIDVVVLGQGRVPVSAATGTTAKGTTSEPAERPHFVTSARPLEVPAELLALPDDARITYEEKIGLASSQGATNAADYREVIQKRIARQARGYFTLEEAARVLADCGLEGDIAITIMNFRDAQARGELTIRPGVGRFPYGAGKKGRDYLDVVEVGELDKWLRAKLGFGFPAAVAAQPAAPLASATASTQYPSTTVAAINPERPKPALVGAGRGRQKSDALTPLIEKARSMADNPDSGPLVFGVLRDMVLKVPHDQPPPTPLEEVTLYRPKKPNEDVEATKSNEDVEAIKWFDGKRYRHLTARALSARMAREKKMRESHGTESQIGHAKAR